MTGTKMNGVAYRGAPPALNDVILLILVSRSRGKGQHGSKEQMFGADQQVPHGGAKRLRAYAKRPKVRLGCSSARTLQTDIDAA
jgi:hypothetical protein